MKDENKDRVINLANAIFDVITTPDVDHPHSQLVVTTALDVARRLYDACPMFLS